MNDKKHIDRLFQEKLKDFEATPSNTVWENISAELKSEEKDRKIIPFWLKLSGIAAALLLLLTVGNAVFNSSDKKPDQDTIVNTDNDPNTDSNETNLTDKQDDIINLDNNNLEKEQLASEDAEMNKSNESQNSNTEADKLINKNSKLSNTVVSTSSARENKTSTQLKKTTVKSTVNDIIDAAKKDAVVKNDDTKKTVEITNSTDAIKNNDVNKNAVNSALNKNNSSENTVAKTTTEENNSINNTEETKKEGEIVELEKEDEKLSIEEVVAENMLHDDVNDKKKKRNKIEDRWKVSPSIAPVYFNTLGSGSSIHEQFNENSKTGDVNMSYGVRGSYALNDKLSVRAGVNKVILGYSTDDVFVLNNVSSTPTDERFQLRNVALKEEAQGTSFVSVEEFNFAQIPSVLSQQIIGSIDQKIGFIEIPLELEYELSNQKLGLRVLGGFSALFLNENEVYSTLNEETTLIGQATNINKTSFSANLGVGLDFKLTEKFKLNLEPTFKYQLNTFSNTSGNFKPYFIGIYSGFSFKF
ncbi:MAG: hypothetical protein DA407_04275 [Bacteroidetes bacterium]|nr:MAG: hypothetical protein DA407_04275 [Bacteroidota bacterium]